MIEESHSYHDATIFTRYCCGDPTPQAQFMFAMMDGHAKLLRAERGCGDPTVNATNPQCAGWSDCSNAINYNYVCSGTSPNVPDFP